MSKMKLALEVVTDLRSLADSIETLVNAIVENQGEPEIISEAEILSEPAPTKSKEKANKKAERVEVPKEEDEPRESAPEVKQPTLEELRAAMADKNRAGHREEIKAILSKYGANKLTALDSVHYVQVLKEAEEIK